MGASPVAAEVVPITLCPITGSWIVWIRGSLVVGTRADAKRTIMRCIDSAIALRVPAHIVVDLAHCEYVDASGFGALLACAKAARIADGSLSLRRANATIREVLELTRLDTLLTVLPAQAVP